MRLFIAIDFSKQAIDELIRVQSIVIDENLKATLSKSFHLTLKFLSEVDEKDIPNLISKFKKIKFTPFTLTLSSLGVFPGKNYIKVVWAGLEENNELKKIYDNINKALPNFKDDHNFSPHITLARVAYVKDKESFIEKLEKTEVKPIVSEIKSFVLYKSTLTPNGSVYEKIEEFS